MRIILLIAVLSLNACTGIDIKETGGYRFEELYSIGLFTPTYQYRRVSKCDVDTIHHDSEHSNGWKEYKYKNCKWIGDKIGFTVDTTSPSGPSILGAGASIGMGALISGGIDGSQSINNNNNYNHNKNSMNNRLVPYIP